MYSGFVHGMRDFDQRSNSRSVVHRAIVNFVAVDRLADSEVIEVSADSDEFVLQGGVGAGQNAGKILRLCGGAFYSRGGANGDCEREMRQGFLRAEKSDNFAE